MALFLLFVGVLAATALAASPIWAILIVLVGLVVLVANK